MVRSTRGGEVCCLLWVRASSAVVARTNRPTAATFVYNEVLKDRRTTNPCRAGCCGYTGIGMGRGGVVVIGADAPGTVSGGGCTGSCSITSGYADCGRILSSGTGAGRAVLGDVDSSGGATSTRTIPGFVEESSVSLSRRHLWNTQSTKTRTMASSRW